MTAEWARGQCASPAARRAERDCVAKGHNWCHPRRDPPDTQFSEPPERDSHAASQPIHSCGYIGIPRRAYALLIPPAAQRAAVATLPPVRNVRLLSTSGSVVVDLDVCVKTGRVTDERVVFAGRVTPSWVTLLLFVSIIGFLIAGSMTSRRFRVTLPLEHAVHDRWRKLRRLALATGTIGAAVLVWAVVSDFNGSRTVAGAGAVALIGAAAIAAANSWMNGVGIRAIGDGGLVITRTHPAFCEAVRNAGLQPVH